jgi:hypothetical protein
MAGLPVCVEHARHRLLNIAMIRYCGSGMPLRGARKHPHLQLHNSEPPDCNRWPLTCFR